VAATSCHHPPPLLPSGTVHRLLTAPLPTRHSCPQFVRPSGMRLVGHCNRSPPAVPSQQHLPAKASAVGCCCCSRCCAACWHGRGVATLLLLTDTPLEPSITAATRCSRERRCCTKPTKRCSTLPAQPPAAAAAAAAALPHATAPFAAMCCAGAEDRPAWIKLTGCRERRQYVACALAANSSDLQSSTQDTWLGEWHHLPDGVPHAVGPLARGLLPPMAQHDASKQAHVAGLGMVEARHLMGSATHAQQATQGRKSTCTFMYCSDSSPGYVPQCHTAAAAEAQQQLAVALGAAVQLQLLYVLKRYRPAPSSKQRYQAQSDRRSVIALATCHSDTL
jgi:hypothetical protein